MRAEGGSGKMNSPSASRSPSRGASEFANVGLDPLAVEPAGLDHRHERRRRVLVDLDGRVLVLDGVEVGATPDGSRGGDHADAAVPGREGRRYRPGPDDAEDGQVVPPAQDAQRDRRGRVAGHHDRLDVLVGQPVERLRREGPHLLVRADAVGRPRVVAEVDRRLAGGPSQDLAQHRQSADARN